MSNKIVFTLSDTLQAPLIISFGTLQEMLAYMRGRAKDRQIHVEAITRNIPTKGAPDEMIKFLVVVTAQTLDGDVAACILQTGSCWSTFLQNRPYHTENLNLAANLVSEHVTLHSFVLEPGAWMLDLVIRQAHYATANLWRIQDHQLIPIEEEDP